MTIETLGVDIAKNVFQLHGVNRNGRVVMKRRVMRDQLLAVLAQIDPCTMVVEACTGVFYWARKFEALGHQVKIISPQYVKPFVRILVLRNKNEIARLTPILEQRLERLAHHGLARRARDAPQRLQFVQVVLDEKLAHFLPPC